MSTYLQGVTDTGFNPLSYTPNFPYMQQALEKAQAKYDTNYNQVANAYHKITDQKLLNPENEIYRKQFLEKTKDQLKQISTKDFSDINTVSEAEQIFAPFWEDDDLMADYKITKEYQKQIQTYETLKNSDKKEDRDRAWSEGLQYVQLTAQNMALAKRGDGSIQNVKVNEYVPNIDVTGEVNKFLNDSGYTKGIESYRTEGGHIVQVINGPGSKASYSAVIDNFLKNRPDLQKIFMVQGTIDYQTLVSRQRQLDPTITIEEADKRAKKEYATEKTSQFEGIINNYNSILKGTNTDEGLLGKYNKLSTEISAMYEKGIEPTIEKINEWKDYKSKIDQSKASIEQYQSAINDLQGEDFNNPKVSGNSYFGNQYRHIFSEGMASARAAASSEKVSTDSEVVSAMKMMQHQIDQDRKYNSEKQTVRTDNKGNVVVTTTGYNADGSPIEISIPSDENIAATVAESSKKVSGSVPDIPTVVDGKTTTIDLQTSFYYNFNKNIEKNRDIFISNTSQYLNLDTQLASKFPSIYKYVDYLTSLVRGNTSEIRTLPSAENLKTIFNSLKNDEKTKSYFNGIESYNQNPILQLKALMDYSDASSVTPNLDRATLRSVLDDAASKYNSAIQIKEGFKKDNTKYKPDTEELPILRKTKEGDYRFINADDIIKLAGNVYQYEQTSLPWYQQLRNTGNLLAPSLVNERKPDYGKLVSYDKLPREIAKAYANGTLNVKSVTRKQWRDDNDGGAYTDNRQSYEYVDENNHVWDLTNLVYDLKSNLPQDIQTKMKNHDAQKGLLFNKYLEKNYPGYDESFVLNKKLVYTNDPSTAKKEIAHKIIIDSISDNRGNIVEGQPEVILPNNYDQLTKDTNRDALNKLLGLIFNNAGELDKVLTSTELSYTGKTSDKSSVTFKLDSDKLNALAKNNSSDSKLSESMVSAITSLATKGVELNINNNTFLKYAQDDYMSSVVTDELLSKGIKASDYEKNKLYYDYTLSPGSNDEIIVTYKVQKYDPQTNTLVWKEFEPQSYPKAIGIDNILKSLRESFLPNTQAIYSYLKQQKDKSTDNHQAFKKLDGETDEERIQRLSNSK